MIGKTLSEFIDELYLNPEIEFLYNGKRYLISGSTDGQNNYSLSVDVIGRGGQNLFFVTNSNRVICVSCFEAAKIFDEHTIYEVENAVTVLYG